MGRRRPEVQVLSPRPYPPLDAGGFLCIIQTMKKPFILLIVIILTISFQSPIVLKAAVIADVFPCAALSPTEGILPEIVKAISELSPSLQFQISCCQTSSEEVIQKLAKGDLDIVFGLRYIENASITLLKYPLISARYALMKRKSSRKIHRVGAVENTRGVEKAKKLFDQVIEYESYEEALEDLVEEKIDGIFGQSNMLGCFLMKRSKLSEKLPNFPNLKRLIAAADEILEGEKSKYELSTSEYERYFFYVACRRNLSPHVRKLIEDAMLKLYKEDVIENLIESYELSEFLKPPNHLKFIVINYPPYVFKEKGEWKGIDVELVERAFESMGFKVELIRMPPMRAFILLKEKAVDGAFSLEVTPERLSFLNFVLEVPVSRGIDVLFSRKENPLDFDDLKGKRCGVVAGYAGENYLKTLGAIVVHVSEDLTGIKMLHMGRIDAFLTNYLVGMHYIKKLGYDEEIVRSKSYRIFESFFAFTKIPAFNLLKDDVRDAVHMWRYSDWYRSMIKKYGFEEEDVWYSR